MNSFVGLSTVNLKDNNDITFPMVIMYPTLAVEKLEKLGPYNINVALDAEPKDGLFPLAIISHGSGGSHFNYRTLAHYLASNGFIVAIPEHPHNNKNNNSLVNTIENFTNRPRLISIVIDWFFTSSLFMRNLKINSVAIIGHSIGGYTALAAAGGIPTSLPSQEGITRKITVIPDQRIQALVLLAPSTVLFREKYSLTNIKIPILMFIGEKDELTGPLCQISKNKKEECMPFGYQAKLVLDGVNNESKIKCVLVQNARHLSFLSPFPKSMISKDFLPSLDPIGFNREEFHKKMNAEILEFLLQNIKL